MLANPAQRSRVKSLAAVLLLAPWLAAGCARSRVEAPLDETLTDRTEVGDMDFWHSLPGRPAVSNSEGLRGVLLLADGTDTTSSYEERLALVKERGWLDPDFAEAGNIAMQRGTLAKALCHAMNIRGGVMMHVLNRPPRYAIRELAYLRIMPQATENQSITGLDYIGVISKAQDYLTARDAKAAGATPAETDSEGSTPEPEPQPPSPAPADGASSDSSPS